MADNDYILQISQEARVTFLFRLFCVMASDVPK
jgi:hypothetical protein